MTKESSMNLRIILGNQLFPTELSCCDSPVFMSEDFTLCTHYKYHKHKLILFLASMRNYRDELIKKNKKVFYYKLSKETSFFSNLVFVIKSQNIKKITTYEIEDKFFEQQLSDFCKNHNLELVTQASPMFLISRDTFKKYNQHVKKPFMKTFYESFRKTSGILMTKEGVPEGGKFSFDTENRKKIPSKGVDIPHHPIKSKFDPNTLDVMKVVEEYFSQHPGDIHHFWLSTTRDEALEEMEYFFNKKFQSFGLYEDAIDKRAPFLFHSTLSPYLNIGFLTPEELVKKALKKNAPLNSKEGFIRQIIGWREFIRGIYQEYSEVQESSNFFNHQRKLNHCWYKGETGILPLDDAIKKAITYGYCHHIERLMIISNIMLLCEIHPTEVHKWFMEMFIDSSDWVMGPNVYGMAQFSDGGIFATKPYISASNYILKMSHYKRDSWCDILDGLYWRFIEKNQDYFKENYRMSMMVKLLQKIEPERKMKIFMMAEDFIKKVTYDGQSCGQNNE